MQEQSITKGGKSTTTAKTLRTGYTFSGWNADEKTGDITLYAKWTVKAENVLNVINSLTEGTYSVCVVGEIDEDAVKSIGRALRSNENAKVNLDLSRTTGLENIPFQGFSGCASLTNIEIPSTVTRIENTVFNLCINLTDVGIPASVTTIVFGAFYDCQNHLHRRHNKRIAKTQGSMSL